MLNRDSNRKNTRCSISLSETDSSGDLRSHRYGSVVSVLHDHLAIRKTICRLGAAFAHN